MTDGSYLLLQVLGSKMVPNRNHSGEEMPSLTVKNVPHEVLAQLRARALQHRRSLQGELLVILEEAVKSNKLTLRDLHEQVKRMGLRTRDDSVTIIRTLRDAR